MPFTLAHPAAVLPFRRFCPRHFNFPALVIGSITPDIGYLFGRWNVDEFSHSLPGSLGFGLPVGIVLMILFYSLRLPVIGILPKRQRQIFSPCASAPLALCPRRSFHFYSGYGHIFCWILSHTNTAGWLSICQLFKPMYFPWKAKPCGFTTSFGMSARSSGSRGFALPTNGGGNFRLKPDAAVQPEQNC